MKITSFRIDNFKSIKSITIPVQTYGKGKNKSGATFLVGVNESGKSSILEAIHLWRKGLDTIDYDDYHHKGSDDANYIRIEANINLEDISYYQNKISEVLNISIEECKKIELSNFKLITWKRPGQLGSYFSFSVENNFPFHEFIYSKAHGIKPLKEFNGVTDTITVLNAKQFLRADQVLLTKKELENQIRLKAHHIFKADLPEVNLWKPQPEYLINEEIDLIEFMENPNISIPLKNIFHIHGFGTNEKIKTEIDKAINKPENKAELQASLSKSITSYINKIWREHKINIKINIDATDCSVHIEDKDKEYKYFSMSQRSDGFNQFASLILSLSTRNDNKDLINNIILLDEPEIHLHPSGIKYMLDEILKIGKSNFVLVATHSHYLIDTTTPERHYIVSKNQMETQIKHISEDTSMNDDQVLMSAFGLNLFKELLPQNILVVEGADDKHIISHSIDLLYKDFFYSIKSAGGASKVYGIASILADEKIPAYFILDDDKEGREAKKNILTNLRGSHSKDRVLTIRDISINIPEKSTLEDLLPINFVKSFFEHEMGHEFNFEKGIPIINQIKAQDESLKNNKEQLNAKKLLLAQEFTKSYSTKNILETELPNLAALINNLIKKIRE